MEIIPLKRATAQMVLAKDIMRSEGPNPLPISRKGTELTQTLIKQLLDMGIQSVAVEEHPICQKEKEGLQEGLDKLAYRFKRLEGNPVMMKIKEIYQDRLIAIKKGEHARKTDSIS